MDNIFVTSCNSIFFKSCISLIASLHKTNLNTIDKIFIYDLGLKKIERNFLSSLKKVDVVDYPASVNNFWDGYLNPVAFAWKCFAIKDAGKYGKNIFYLDSGAVVLRDVKIIYDIISRDDIFLVGDDHLNKKWTHAKCIEVMNASESEINDFQLWAGTLGYKVDGKYQNLIDEAFAYSKIKECITGDRKYHRHDQSIYSILASRYSCPRQDLRIFGEWFSLEKAVKQNSVIYVHRRTYYNCNGLINKYDKKISLPINIKIFLLKERIFKKIDKIVKKLIHT
jgi:hypothetical protein